MMEAAKGITSTTGVAGLYRGLGVTLLEIIPYAALQFGLYDAFMEAANKARIRRNNNNSNNNNGGGSRNKNTDNNKNKIGHSSIQTFLCGLAAGTIAKLGTHPLDVAKKRFQVAGLARNVAYGQRIAPESVTSLSLCCREMLQKEGIAGFYKGALPSVMKAAPAAAVTFAAYEAILRAIVAAKTKDINMNGGDGDLVEKRVLD
jgi:solute carrier family 25 (mitochondrial thiamine pyrophosphate transporter), member 19